MSLFPKQVRSNKSIWSWRDSTFWGEVAQSRMAATIVAKALGAGQAVDAGLLNGTEALKVDSLNLRLAEEAFLLGIVINIAAQTHAVRKLGGIEKLLIGMTAKCPHRSEWCSA
jgi:hypothetical protein